MYITASNGPKETRIFVPLKLANFLLRVRTSEIKANLEKIRYQQNSFPTPSGWYGGLPKNSFTMKLAGKKSYASVPKPYEIYVFSEEYYPVPNSLRSIFDIKCVKIEGI